MSSRTEAQQRARQMWDAACERLAKALQPASTPASGGQTSDLTEALLVAQLSLDAVRAAFEVEGRSEQQARNEAQQQQRRNRERS